MSIENIIKYSIAVVSVLLIIFVLLQNNQGGLGSIFGGGASGGEAYRSKRGIEAVMYNGTMVLGIIFSVLCVALMLV